MLIVFIQPANRKAALAEEYMPGAPSKVIFGAIRL
jgi:hypothetical protein